MERQKFNDAYRELLCMLYYSRVDEENVRTKHKIRMVEGGWSFKLNLTDGLLPVAGNRRYWPRVAAAETAWQFMGTQDPDFILSKAPKLWKDFVRDGKIETAYGHRWRQHFGRDQLRLAVEELISNPTNRQLYISAWDPSRDGLGGKQPPNVPCPVGFSLTRTPAEPADMVHLSVFIRSSDVFVGLPYDVMCYALTLDAIAATANCRPGYLHVTLAHPHIYHVHLPHLEDCIAGPQEESLKGMHWEARKKREDRRIWTCDVEPQLPAWTVADIEERPDDYVEHVRRLSNRANSSDWNPLPELVI